ncbi:MAG: efflux RND transporter permease subunit [Pseudomonadota bacterium]
MAAKSVKTGGLFGWFIGNSVAANLLMLFMIGGGYFAATNLKTETFPEIDPHQIRITVPYPGATPAEVEQAITKRVEEAVLGIDGVDRVRSSAAENSGRVTIELKDFVDSQIVKDDVEAAVDQLADFPPAEAERPQVVVVEPPSTVMRLAIFGDLTELELRAAAERVEDDLLLLEDVTDVKLFGVRSREISIEVSESVLRQYGLSLGQVAAAVNRASLDLSGGTLRTSGGEILLRTDAERRVGPAFNDIVVFSDERGRDIRLGEIANVIDGFEDGDLINTYQGSPAAFIDVEAGDDQDAFDVSGAVRGMLENYAPPAGASVAIVNDDTLIVADRLNLLVRNAIMGLALVFVFLAISLDLRLAFWTSVGILVAFMGAFLIIGQFTTINMITLFGLIVVLGLVVDDAIVIGENIYDEQNAGRDCREAAVRGVLGVAAPVTVGVLTSVAAFAPLLFSTGTLGQIMAPVPVVVIAVLTMSVIEAFLILPSHLSHGGDWSRGPMALVKARGQALLEFVRDKIVLPIVDRAARAPYAALAISAGVLIIVAGIVASGSIRFIFFPQIESDEVLVTLEMPDGTPFSRTEAAVRRIESVALEAAGGEGNPNIESLSVTIGALPAGDSSPVAADTGSTLGSHLGGVVMKLTAPAERSLSSAEIERRWRSGVGEIAGARNLTFDASLVGGSADISIDLSHRDDERLFDAVAKLEKELRRINGVNEIESGLNDGKTQLDFALTPAGAAAGLTAQDIAQQLRQAFFGDEVQRIQRDREEVRVYVRYPADERRSLSELDRFRVRLPGGGEAPLNVVAKMTESVSPTTIDRVDGRRVIAIEADVDEAVTTPNQALAVIIDTILPELLSSDPELQYSLEGQTRDQREELASAGANLLLALGIIYVMLASVLRSYVQPLVIMLAIPFGAANAVIGHLILGYDLSFLSIFGMVALSGVIVNSSVVLIDHYNKRRREFDETARESALAAVKRRFRPILLTTMTTFLGLLPMLTETSLQAQFLIPMAISLGFGILLTGFIILPVVPAILMVIEDANQLRKRIAKAWDAGVESAA